MAFSPCLHAEPSATRIPMHGSRLVVCRVCWEVIDPAARVVPPRTFKRSELTDEARTEHEKLNLKSPSTKPSTADEPADEFAVPLPRRRLLTSAYLPNKLLLISTFAVPFTIYAICFYWMYHPTFREHTDPTQQYVASFPGDPIWSGGSHGGGSDGEALRKMWGIPETYRIRITTVSEKGYGRTKGLDSTILAVFLVSGSSSSVRPRPDVLHASACAEFELWINGKDVIVGRTMVVSGMVYEMTVRGRRLSLDDSRIQKFFNSFRFAPL
jgi:hypothetical protein